jgi:kumamolisin
MNALLEEAAAQGQGVFTSTGDYGAYDAHRAWLTNDRNYNKLMTPSTSPWVTAVGGAELQGSNGNYTELAWSQTGSKPEDQMGGGGGVSVLNGHPWYQSGNEMRQTPDVSALAGDPGYLDYSYNSDQKQSGWGASVGTSLSTPLWAAYATLVNQWLGQPVGFYNPSIYALAQRYAGAQSPPLHDITTGDNLYYKATPGWDAATGWGSMDASMFATDLKSMGALVAHPSAFSVRLWVTQYINHRWKYFTTLQRGQKYYLYNTTTSRICGRV